MQANDTSNQDAGAAGNGVKGTVPAPTSLAEFRVLTHEGRKHAFKLERIFWKILENAAASGKQRMGAYVASLLETTAPDTNRTAMLRTHAAEWISSRLADTTARALSPRFLLKVVQATPLPCIAIDSNDRITAHNDLFVTLLNKASHDSTRERVDKVRVSFGRDIATVRDNLLVQRGAYLVEVVRLDTGAETLHRTARIIGMESVQGLAIGMLVLIQD